MLTLILRPFAALRGPGSTFGQNFDIEIRRDHVKIHMNSASMSR